MKRLVVIALGSLVCLSLLASMAYAQNGVTLITSADVDYSHNTLTVIGTNFGLSPKVTLGAATLTAQSATATQVVANFPSSALPSSFVPGTYFLTVTFSNGRFAVFTVALGATGPQGPAGPQGPMGFQGATGATGPAGPGGATGVAGAQGPQGLKGDAGAIGATGVTGLKGDTGAQGATGPAGFPGAPGQPGTPGADSTVPGPTGATGPNGHSPYCGTWTPYHCSNLGTGGASPYQIGDMVTDPNGNPGPYYNLTGTDSANGPAKDTINWIYCCSNGAAPPAPAPAPAPAMTGQINNVPGGTDSLVPIVGQFDGGQLPCPLPVPNSQAADPACSWTATANFNVSSFSATYVPTAGAPPGTTSGFVVRVCGIPGNATSCGFLGGHYPTCLGAPGSTSCSNSFPTVLIFPGSVVSMEVITPSTKLMTLFRWRRIGRGVRENNSSPTWA
jgi:hypothetical protein